MADPRIIAVALDADTILSPSPEVERERQVAAADLVATSHFLPCRPAARGQEGPWRVALRIADGRLAIDIADEGGRPAETILLGLARFRRPMRDYFAMLDSYAQAVAGGQPARIETVDMARRGLHNEGAALLAECLEGKVELDHDTARRLFTLLAALHARG